MKSFYLSSILLLALLSILAEPGDDEVYCVSPTEQLSSCPRNSGHPPAAGRPVYTLDYLAKNSKTLFSPNNTNIVILKFMCGVHNCTNNMTIQNLHSFVMKGESESRENVIINMLHRMTLPITFGMHVNKPICTSINFFNVSFVNLTAMTMLCPSISLKGGLITVKGSNFHGYTGLNDVLSFIFITGRNSQAILDDCVFQENCCFIMSNMSGGINVNNSTFQLYRHLTQSIVMANSSVITLTGYVNFADSIVGFDPKTQRAGPGSGTALCLHTTCRNHKSVLNISK